MTLSRTNVGSWASAAGHGTGSFSTGSFTPPANSLLVVFVSMMGVNTFGDLGQPTISGGSLAYTFRGRAYGIEVWSHRVNVFTAPVGSSPASMTITVDDDANQDIYTYCVVALAYTGHDTTTPIAGWVDSGSTDIGDGAHSLTLAAAPAAGDETLACLSIDADGTQTSPSWSGFTEIYDVVRGDGGASLAVAYRTGSTSTTVSVTDVFTESGSFYKGSMLAFTVKASAASPVTLTVQDAAHGHTAESPALTQTHILAAADAAHNHAAENVTLTQTHNLSVDDALHGHTVDSPALTQTHNLTAADAAHAHTADSPDLGQTHILEIQDAFHAQTADNVTLTVAVTLEVQDARHGHSAENVTFTQTHILGVAGALHVHLVDVVTLMIIQRIVMVNSIVIEQISVSGQVQELFQVDSIVAELFSVNSEDAI